MEDAKTAKNFAPPNDAWVLRLYVAGQTPDWKKAMVTLHEGNTIEIL